MLLCINNQTAMLTITTQQYTVSWTLNAKEYQMCNELNLINDKKTHRIKTKNLLIGKSHNLKRKYSKLPTKSCMMCKRMQ